MSDKTYERFGRYLLLDHFVDGGMAKICRARYLGEQADKIVAIKMVQPQYSKDESFRTMFMDEIKVAFGLIHPNIIQTYDYGMHRGQLYVAMEYCDGKNLKEYLDKLKERKFVFPVEISVYIITQVCQGLHYAHTLTDKLTGKSQNIVHRDISPHNIMLTYDGAVKVIDFGIAKAETNSEATQAGTIKGKLSYLAPEYLDGKKLDARYDEFAVGITLWEMLCSRKLFKAPNDLAVLKKIQECKIPPPSKINPNVPKELDDIVLKALHKNREKRYENLDQLNRALMKFLYSNYPDFNATDLNYFAKELFKEDIRKDREKFIEYGKIDLTPFLNEMKNEGMMGGGTTESSGEPAPSTASSKESTSTVSKVRQEQELDFGFEESDEKTKSNIRIKRPSSSSTGIRNKKDLLAGSKSKTLNTKKKKTAKTGLVKVGSEEAQSPGGVDLSVEIQKKRKSRSQMAKDNTATVRKVDRTSTKTGVGFKSKKKNLAPVAGVAVLLIAGFFGVQKAPDSIKEMIGLKTPEVRNPAAVKNTPVVEDEEPEALGRLTLENFDKRRQNLYVNGVKKEVSVLGDVELPFGSNMAIRVETPGREHFVRNVTLGQSQPTVKIKIPDNLKNATYGFLATNGNCIKGKLYFNLYNENRIEPLPSPRKRIAFPLIYENGRVLPTEYTVNYVNEADGLKRKLTFKLDGESDIVDFCNVMYQSQ